MNVVRNEGNKKKKKMWKWWLHVLSCRPWPYHVLSIIRDTSAFSTDISLPLASQYHPKIFAIIIIQINYWYYEREYF